MIKLKHILEATMSTDLDTYKIADSFTPSELKQLKADGKISAEVYNGAIELQRSWKQSHPTMRIGGGAYKNQMMKQLNEVMYKDRSGKSFNIKGISIIYTEQGGRFYGTSLYDVPKTSNVSKKSKIGLDDTNALFKSMGIKGEVSRFYEPDELEKFAKQLKAKGIVYDYADIMDVS
tara:strand:+ start:1819 stop:2346 length:528 start_codon:yes stop_codon:yes gene_type:complete